ncbi:type VI secretion system amidase effector protein Tae4 [Burkholderia sp. Ax-1719]|uniref:type VI secretion system amidase effector protein Tae4 n=1 Tax=Burkholderia sp. Ax-1719 TaxID=2608334 RepID=UPI00141EE3DC|nr:type VI secretion system amidase effector protein Tae4 [Burkholderia sp. Ax-1719]NIE64659.1 hypothetical protein [Burkholderia sp. Ax-1719]
MPNRRVAIQTNPTPNSIKDIQLKVLTFNELWNSYPSGNPYKNPDYPDQCAIRLSVAFHRVGIEMKSFSSKLVKPLARQSSIGRIILDGKATATRANELAEWLRLRPIAGVDKAEDITGENWVSRIKGRTGIVMFDGYWYREGEAVANPSGGHIDLWNGSKLTGIGTGFRVNWNIVIPGIWEDFRKSRTILFFPLK